MPKVRKTELAQQDLIDIWVFTHHCWGELQAERYFSQLEEGIGRLERYPELGRRCDDVRSGYRALRVGRHVIYYTATDDPVRVVRVLHERMDVEKTELEL